MAYIEHDFPIEGLNKIAQKEGNANGWLPERHLPDKALDLLEEACGPTGLSAGLAVTARTVAEALVGWTGVPAKVPLD